MVDYSAVRVSFRVGLIQTGETAAVTAELNCLLCTSTSFRFLVHRNKSSTTY